MSAKDQIETRRALELVRRAIYELEAGDVEASRELLEELLHEIRAGAGR